MNKRGQKTSKLVELSMKNTFDEWRVLMGFDIGKFILILMKMKTKGLGGHNPHVCSMSCKNRW